MIDEADELVQRINFDVLNELEEEHRCSLKYMRKNLKKLNPKLRAEAIRKNHGQQAPARKAFMKRFLIL